MTGQHLTPQQTYRKGIYECLCEGHASTAYKSIPMNSEKMMQLIEFCIQDGFVYFDGECLMLGKTFEPWFSDEIAASDIVLYTIKGSRGKGLAKKAVECFIDWANSKGVKRGNITLAQSTGTNSKEFKRLAEAFNMTKVGEVYNV